MEAGRLGSDNKDTQFAKRLSAESFYSRQNDDITAQNEKHHTTMSNRAAHDNNG
jgi:hypothetical protein